MKAASAAAVLAFYLIPSIVGAAPGSANTKVDSPVPETRLSQLEALLYRMNAPVVSSVGKRSEADIPAPFGCYWQGHAPFCEDNMCPPGYAEMQRGNCGDGECCEEHNKVLCCRADQSCDGE
ncbi:hypothetical protein D9613_011616 [Agrocybe pediades]|uniref:Uncharacterized protein n=1 Tax=Agrocybe pediades TaxID=84607 RepID=A0A8H4QVA7_9AGAR|nr:hypothetical protein D9613_011616 [Agrocybe pediades]